MSSPCIGPVVRPKADALGPQGRDSGDWLSGFPWERLKMTRDFKN